MQKLELREEEARSLTAYLLSLRTREQPRRSGVLLDHPIPMSVRGRVSIVFAGLFSMMIPRDATENFAGDGLARIDEAVPSQR